MKLSLALTSIQKFVAAAVDARVTVLIKEGEEKTKIEEYGAAILTVSQRMEIEGTEPVIEAEDDNMEEDLSPLFVREVEDETFNNSNTNANDPEEIEALLILESLEQKKAGCAAETSQDSPNEAAARLPQPLSPVEDPRPVGLNAPVQAPAPSAGHLPIPKQIHGTSSSRRHLQLPQTPLLRSVYPVIRELEGNSDDDSDDDNSGSIPIPPPDFTKPGSPGRSKASASDLGSMGSNYSPSSISTYEASNPFGADRKMNYSSSTYHNRKRQRSPDVLETPGEGESQTNLRPPKRQQRGLQGHPTALDSHNPARTDNVTSGVAGGATAPPPVPDTEDTLVTTDVLNAHGLAFNREYGLLICQSCGVGFPLRATTTHLKTMHMKRMTWSDHKNAWSLANFPTQHNASDMQVTASFKNKVSNSLREAGFISDAADILDTGSHKDWVTLTSEIRSGRNQAVAGLELYRNAMQCGEPGCARISLSHKVLQNHWYDCHNDQDEEEQETRPQKQGGKAGPKKNAKKGKGKKKKSRFPDVIKVPAVQTMCEFVGGWVDFFEVDVSNLPNTNQPADTTNPGAQMTTEEKLRAKMGRIVNSLKPVADRDIREVLPAHSDTGIDQFLSRFDRATVQHPFKIDKKNTALNNLRKIVVQSFYEDAEKAVSLHGSILVHMTNCTEGVPSRFQKRQFEVPSLRASRASYASQEVRMLWTILQGYMRFQKPNNPFIAFNENQLATLEGLQQALDVDPFDSDHATGCLYKVFDEVYFPQHPGTSQDVFCTPVVAYLALQCLCEDGSYRDIHLFPPLLAKIQFAIRLRAAHKFVRWTAESVDDLLAKCRSFSVTHLQDYNMSPFSALRSFMHRFSAASKNQPRAATVWWKENTVEVEETVVDFDEYKQFLQQTLEKTEKDVLQEVLLGLFDMQQVDDLLGFAAMENLSLADKSIHGKGLLLDASDPHFHNDGFVKMFDVMEKHGCLGVHQNAQGSLTFDREKSLQWLKAVDMALENVMCLCHVLQGPPGRMTEEAALPLTNTYNMKHALFWDAVEQTGGFRSGYHKGAYITGDQKRILRLLPRRIFRLLYILVRLARPLDFMLAFDFIVNEDRRQATMDAYGTNVFASLGRGWDSNYRNIVLARFFNNGMGIHMGTRKYRHLAVAVLRRFPQKKSADEVAEARLAGVADIMAGHTTTVAEMNYAVEARPIIGRVAEKEFISVCKYWHKLHGFSTGEKLTDLGGV